MIGVNKDKMLRLRIKKKISEMIARMPYVAVAHERPELGGYSCLPAKAKGYGQGSGMGCPRLHVSEWTTYD
jgi:hypothetical protein